MGSSSFCIPILDGLISSSHKIVAVYTQPPKHAGRGKKIVEVPVASYAKKKSLKIYQPENFGDPLEITKLSNLKPDIILVVAYGLILPREVLKIPKIAAINVHASILPRWRGAAPIQRALMGGDKSTGITLMKMEEGLDTGPIYETAAEPILNTDTFLRLSEKLSRLAEVLVLKFLENSKNLPVPSAQNKNGISYAKKISKAETRIIWSKSASEIDFLIRGLSGTLGAWTNIKGERVKILSSSLGQTKMAKVEDRAGTILGISDKGIEIACGEGFVVVDQLQRSGKNSLRFSELIKGFKIVRGEFCT